MPLIFIIGCGGPHAPTRETTNVNTSTPKSAEVTAGNYKSTVLEIIKNRCQPCHIPGGALPNWQDYKTAYNKREKIYQRVVVEKSMPPPSFSTISDEERKIIGDWIQAGAPE